jgi:hypothetical protein
VGGWVKWGEAGRRGEDEEGEAQKKDAVEAIGTEGRPSRRREKGRKKMGSRGHALPPVCVIGTLNNEMLTSAMQLLWRCQVASHLLLSQLSWREAMLGRYLAKKPSVRPRMGVSCVAPVEWCTCPWCYAAGILLQSGCASVS